MAVAAGENQLRPAAPPRNEQRLVWGALALIALHVIVVGLIDLRPGVGRGDHLLAVIVPLSLLALAAWSYPRMRPGWRALLAGTLAVLALVGGGLALSGGGGAATGALMFVSAAILLAAGGFGLWTARRRDGHWLARRLLIGFGVLLFAFEVILPLSLALLATQRPAGDAVALSLGPGTREVTIETRNGLRLAGTYVPSRNGAAVVTFPVRDWTEDQSRMLAMQGYGVLALDMRGYGGSEGDPNAYGWGATSDIDAGVEFLMTQPGVSRVGGLGLSVGGEQMIEAAAGNPELSALVSESAGERSFRETLIRGPAAALVIPQALAQSAAAMVFSGEAPPPSLKGEIAKVSPRAVMLIRALNGSGGEDLNTEYYAAAGRPKVLWTIPDATHTDGINARPAEYAARVDRFFDRHLNSE